MIVDSTVLILAAFLTSAMTAVIGLGGGILLIALVANILPPLAVIPVHGAVQLCSNASRALFSRRDLLWDILPAFCFGIVVGSLCGFPLLKVVPAEYLPLPLACFILLMIWMPQLKSGFRLPGAFLLLGWLQGFLTLFVGATGVLNPPFLIRRGLSSNQVVATHALLMTVVHVAKILVFGLLGFSFAEYGPLLIAMVAAVVFGSWVGTRLRRKVADDKLKITLKLVITALALRMIWKALSGA